jgi:long-chain fatty acid transport protein
MPTRSNFWLGLLLTAALLSPLPARAAGFAVQEQSARGLGRAFAGEVTDVGEPSGLWYNPSGSAFAKGRAISGSLSGVYSTGALNNRGSTLTLPNGAVVPTSGPAGKDPLEFGAVPTAAMVGRDGAWGWGVTLNAPFGFTTAYPFNWYGRYDSTRTELQTVNLELSAARRFGDRFALGAGIGVQRADAVLESALPNLAPGAPDGRGQVRGDDVSLSLSVGATWKPSDRVTIAAAYRHRVRHQIAGDFTASGLLGPLAARNGTAGARATAVLPASASLGARIGVSDRTTLLAEATWTGWSAFQALDVDLSTGTRLTNDFEYRDTMRYALGVEHAASDRLTLRAGAQRDETPTREGVRSTRVPDGDRTWGALGASYELTDKARLDVGLAYVHVDKTAMTSAETVFAGTPAATRVNVRSELKGDATIFSLGLKRAF